MDLPGAGAPFVRAVAPGKINLILKVGPLRPDGYHDLLTCFHAVDIWETVTVTSAEDYVVTIHGDVNLGEVPLDSNNLAVKAAQAVASELGIDSKVAIDIIKKVPVGGGMGGGSADAAATLIAVNELWQGGLSQIALLDIASTLGADVPFLLEGSSQIGRGHGGDLEPIRSLPLWWVVVTAVEHLSTPMVYQNLDRQRGDLDVTLPPDVPSAFRQALLAGDPRALAPHLANDMQASTLELLPQLLGTLERGLELGALASMVSGSGPSCILLAKDLNHAERLHQGLADQGTYSIVTSSPARGAHLVPTG
jgi:4-diphosphocytidyl-2-C-methyl-D-erythritol kinase